jgi:uncharacterized membrane protein YphA (DoxX/SURF4 family)
MTPEYVEAVAWLTLRIVYAWIYLYPAQGLIRDWPTTVETTGLLLSRGTSFFALVSVTGMIVGALMILLGVYGQFAAVGLFAFNVGGAIIHYRLAAMAKSTRISDLAAADDQTTVERLATLGWVGHVTSAEKNFVLAAVAVFFALVGTGPCSLVPSGGIVGN